MINKGDCSSYISGIDTKMHSGEPTQEEPTACTEEIGDPALPTLVVGSI